MFCTNCGTMFDGNFCPKCGTPSFSNPSSGPAPQTPLYPDPPLGEYSASPGALIINRDYLVIAGKRLNVKIPYVAIQDVKFNKAPLGGSLRIGWDPAKVFFENTAITKNYHVFEFTPAKFKEFSIVYQFINKIVSINLPKDAYPETLAPAPHCQEINITERPLSAKERIKENKKNGIACCPKCGSTSISANKKGFGVGKAAAGVLMTGGIGVVAGGIGSKKVIITCLNCGHQWKS